MSIGFRDETIDMKNCILKFVTEQWDEKVIYICLFNFNVEQSRVC
jgi:hypothetical protein